MSEATHSGGGALSLFKHPSQFHLFGDRFFKGDGLEHGRPPITVSQVHGDCITRLNDDGSLPEPLTANGQSSRILEGDGLITDRRGCFIAVSTADCVPLILFDPTRKVIAVLHAGWRGSVLNIAARGVETMALDFDSDPQEIFAGIGPSIGSCCFKIKDDVFKEIAESTIHGQDIIHKVEAGRWACDLPTLNRMQLLDAGLRSENVKVSGRCTSCLPEQYYSFRRDGKKLGNMLSGIMLR